jgi:hypothetical protein
VSFGNRAGTIPIVETDRKVLGVDCREDRSDEPISFDRTTSLTVKKYQYAWSGLTISCLTMAGPSRTVRLGKQ